jgi:hypothetical protein
MQSEGQYNNYLDEQYTERTHNTHILRNKTYSGIQSQDSSS